MKLFWKYGRHWKVVVAFVLMLGYAFNGVLLSSIVVCAGRLTSSSTISEITIFGFASLLAWIIIYSAHFYFTITVASLIQEVNLKIKSNFFWNSFQKNNANNDSSQVISKLSNDMRLVEVNYLDNVFLIFSDSLLCLVSLVYILYLNFAISLIFMIFSFLPMLVPKVFGPKLEKRGKSWSTASENFVKEIKEVLLGSNVLKAYSSLVEPFRRSDARIRDMEAKNFELTKTQSNAELVAAILSGISFVLPFAIGCYVIVLGGSLSFNVLIAIFLANDRVVGPLRELANYLSKMNTTKQLRQDLIDDIPERKDPINIVSRKSVRLKELRFENVHYLISNGQQINVNKTFKGIFRVLIRGDSGVGKSTLLNLIKGALSPSSGSINLIDISGCPISASENIAYIEQTPFIFDNTVKENITLFQDSNYSDEQLITVLKDVSLLDQLGGNNILNRECGQNGSKLSGGQRQKIEIARALLRNKSLYLVDEVTANLDRQNGRQIRDVLFNLNKPIIEVAHHIDEFESRYTNKFTLVNGQLV